MIQQLAGQTLMKVFFILATALLYTLIPSTTIALDFQAYPGHVSNTLNAISAKGEITPGDADRLDSFLKRIKPKPNTAIYLASPGGSLYEGMKLGLLFKSRRIKTVIDGGFDCASACALAFLGGTGNDGLPWRSSSTNSRLGFHAFSSVDKGSLNSDELQRVVSDILRYGKTVRAPTELLIVNFATASDDIFWVDNSDICALGIKLWSVET